jgi:hypothetical protein
MTLIDWFPETTILNIFMDMLLMMFNHHLMSLLQACITSILVSSSIRSLLFQYLFTHPYTTHLKVNETLGNWPLNFLRQFVEDFFLVQISTLKPSALYCMAHSHTHTQTIYVTITTLCSARTTENNLHSLQQHMKQDSEYGIRWFNVTEHTAINRWGNESYRVISS